MIRLTVLLSMSLLLLGCQSSEPGQSSLATSEVTIRANDEEIIPLDEVPTAALAAAEKAAPGVTFDRAERETEDGRVVYGLEGMLDGVRHEVEVTADGDVLEVESGDQDDEEDDDDGDEEDEEEIALEDVPADILAAAKAAVPGASFSKAYTETEDGQKVYELVGEADGERVEVEVSTDAKVLEIERGDDDDDDDDDGDDD